MSTPLPSTTAPVGLVEPGRPTSTREMLRPVSNGPPPTIPRATVQTVVAEAIREVLEADVTSGPDVTAIRYVVPRHPCSPDEACLPLWPVLEDVLAETPVPVGHLHRTTQDPAAEVAPLAVFGRFVAATVARDLLDIRLARTEHTVDNLTIALESSRVIGVAIGILMATRHCTAVEGFDELKRASQNQNRKLRDVAAEVEFTGTVLRAASERKRA